MTYKEYRNLEEAYEKQSDRIHELLKGQLAPTLEQYLKGKRNERKILHRSVGASVHPGAPGAGNTRQHGKDGGHGGNQSGNS